jgi:hypothetical protein
MNDLPTLEQAEDAAARALAALILGGVRWRLADDHLTTLREASNAAVECAVRDTCHELLRGPLAEDYSRQPGGYCMRAPTDPTLRAIGRLGARLVELSYTSPANKAAAEADELWAALRKEINP